MQLIFLCWSTYQTRQLGTLSNSFTDLEIINVLVYLFTLNKNTLSVQDLSAPNHTTLPFNSFCIYIWSNPLIFFYIHLLIVLVTDIPQQLLYSELFLFMYISPLMHFKNMPNRKSHELTVPYFYSSIFILLLSVDNPIYVQLAGIDYVGLSCLCR